MFKLKVMRGEVVTLKAPSERGNIRIAFIV